MTQEIVGYFVWMRTNRGVPSPKKFIAEMLNVGKDTKEYYDSRTLTKPPIPLNAEEWKMTLDELAERYPAPKQE